MLVEQAREVARRWTAAHATGMPGFAGAREVADFLIAANPTIA
jgi:hypothetical protein